MNFPKTFRELRDTEFKRQLIDNEIHRGFLGKLRKRVKIKIKRDQKRLRRDKSSELNSTEGMKNGI